MRRSERLRRTLSLVVVSLCAGSVMAQSTKEQKRPAATLPPRPAPTQRSTPPPAANRPAYVPPSGNLRPTPATPTVPPYTRARGYAPGTPTATPARPGTPPANGYTPRTETPGASPASPNSPGAGSRYGAGPTSTAVPSTTYPHPAPGYGSRTPGSAPAFAGNAPRPAPRPPVTSTTLSPASSGAAVNRLNASRASMTGMNRRPLPSGTVVQRSDGTSVLQASGGREYHLRSNGSVSSVSLQDGQRASFHSNGRMAAFHSQNLDVVHGPLGGRTVAFTRPDRSVVVSHGLHSGYVQREVAFHGHPYYQRTVLIGGQHYDRAYTGYSFRGVVLQSYVPHFHYSPEFYGWAYYPWQTPVAYSWTWGATPAFGSYFVPAQSYAAPYDWLTDYYVGQTISDAYTAGQADGAAQQADQDAYATQQGYPDPNQPAYADPNTAPADAELAAPVDTPISPEVRQTLSMQVQQQIAYENAAASAPQPEDGSRLADLPQVLQPNHIFVVSSTLDAVTPQEMTCNLSAGDTLQLADAPAADATTADLVVASSRRSDCPAGVHVALTLDHLEEMQNSFRAHLDDGLKNLHDQQGKRLPAAPASAIAAPPRPVEYPPSSVEDVAQAIAVANQQGTKAESGATLAAFNAAAQSQQ